MKRSSKENLNTNYVYKLIVEGNVYENLSFFNKIGQK